MGRTGLIPVHPAEHALSEQDGARWASRKATPNRRPRQTSSGPCLGPPRPHLEGRRLDVTLDQCENRADFESGAVGEREDGLEWRQGAFDHLGAKLVANLTGDRRRGGQDGSLAV